MRSFAVVAGFAAAANAYAYGYPAINSTSVAPPTYETSAAPEYAVSSAASEYPAYTTTSVVTGLSTVCSEATTLTYGTKTYTVSSSTTLVDTACEYTTTYEVKPTPSAVTPTEAYTAPAYSGAVPAGSSAVPAPVYSSGAPIPYPSNGTTAYPTGVKPSSTNPSTPEFTGAAGKATVGVLAIAGALAAFL